MVEYYPISVRDRSRLRQFGKKVSPGIFLGYALVAGEILQGEILVADIEELENMDASEIHPRRIIAKEVLTPQSGEYHLGENYYRQMSFVFVRNTQLHT